MNFIFDWSGTLANNEHEMHRAVQRIFLDYGRSLSYGRFKREFKQPLFVFYQENLPGVSEKTIKTKLIRYYSRSAAPRLFKNIKRQLLLLKKNNGKIFVFSSHPAKLIKRELSQNKILSIPQEVFAGVRDKRKELAQLISARGLDCRETFYIGDMVDDISSARDAHIISVAVGWGYHKKAALLRKYPDILVDVPSRLSAVLLKYKKY